MAADNIQAVGAAQQHNERSEYQFRLSADLGVGKVSDRPNKTR
jgi:hypothetical protein